jgi:hypothetical protein
MIKSSHIETCTTLVEKMSANWHFHRYAHERKLKSMLSVVIPLCCLITRVKTIDHALRTPTDGRK